MTPFQPPTDNLYKFMAVSGVVLFIAGFFVPTAYFLQTGFDYLTQARGSDELKVHRKFTDERLQNLQVRGDKAKEELNRMEELKKSSNSAEADKLEGRIKEAQHEIESIEDASYELNLNLAMKEAQIKYEEDVSYNRLLTARLFLLGGAIVGGVGAYIARKGFRLWYERLQKFQDLATARDAQDKLLAAKIADSDNPA